ncbi:hypothetical protein HCB44_10230 [Listeria sp. FSL L7-0229]|uniref:hypothetical protein n=1 Tax=Listeria cossartiae TaxID=2838249 RepID=UPI001629F545|nr:hypothetical protein [Listeria cossartiae]MBC2186540.1 hypothetical protein [Listeria cossartiae subsp. cossartiae]MBC2192644.1 hypothetical protein [Listeria cossartiae subsp. cossartiae]
MKKVSMEKWLIGVYVFTVIASICIYFATGFLIMLACAFISLLGTAFQTLRYRNAKKEANHS